MNQVLIFITSLLFSQIVNAQNVCVNYNEINSEDRKNISDTRFDLESINQEVSDSAYKVIFNEVINSRSDTFIKPSMKNYLQGLRAEALFRRSVFHTIGLDNLSFKRFQIFSDLILYHRAIDYKGFVNLEQFSKSRTNLELVINDYFNKKEIPFIKSINILDKNLLNGQHNIQATKKAKAFVKIENKRYEMLGAIDLIWINLLQRNQFNKTEIISDLAIADLSVNAASALLGFTALVGYGPEVLRTAQALWTMPLSIASGCAFGVGMTYFTNGINTSYLEMSRALYKSVLSHTSFACELGQQTASKVKSSQDEIPYEEPVAGPLKYLMSCASIGASMVFPEAILPAISGMQLASFTTSSYHLIKESVVILEEVPKLYRMKLLKKELQDPNKIAALDHKIDETKAKITLYLLAFGGTSVTEVRLGFFLYGGRNNLLNVIQRAEQFLLTSSSGQNANTEFMSLILNRFRSL